MNQRLSKSMLHRNPSERERYFTALNQSPQHKLHPNMEDDNLEEFEMIINKILDLVSCKDCKGLD